MKIAICEDEAYTIDILKTLISDYMEEKNISYQLNAFMTGAEFFSSTEDYDLYLLDYNLPDATGMEIAERIRLTNKRAVIIFITAYSEYVFKSFEVNTFRYLLKPIEKETLFKALDDFLISFDQYLRVEIPMPSGTIFVSLPEIMYIESSGRYTTVRCNNTSYTSQKALSAFVSEINSFRFFRTHRTFLVNMKYIAEIDGHIITLINGEKIEISRRNLALFHKAYVNFLKYADM